MVVEVTVEVKLNTLIVSKAEGATVVNTSSLMGKSISSEYSESDKTSDAKGRCLWSNISTVIRKLFPHSLYQCDKLRKF